MPFRPLRAAALAALAASSLFLDATFAAAPMVKTQAPGYYRMMLGDFEVTALSDGTLGLPVSTLLTNTTPERVKKVLARASLKEPVDTSVNGYLINTGTKLVLIDTGAGALFGPTVGKLIDNLKAAGYQPEQVDEIYITHMHGDHVGGLMAGDKLVFPNATVRADKRDADYWLNKSKMDAAPKDAKEMFQGAMASLNPYVAAGKFKTFDGATELVPGVRRNGGSRAYARAHDLRRREQGRQAGAVGRPHARRGRAVSRACSNDPVRHGFESCRDATQAGLRRCRQERLLGRRRTHRVSGPWPSAGRRQRLCLDSRELHIAALNGSLPLPGGSHGTMCPGVDRRLVQRFSLHKRSTKR